MQNTPQKSKGALLADAIIQVVEGLLATPAENTLEHIRKDAVKTLLLPKMKQEMGALARMSDEEILNMVDGFIKALEGVKNG